MIRVTPSGYWLRCPVTDRICEVRGLPNPQAVVLDGVVYATAETAIAILAHEAMQ